MSDTLFGSAPKGTFKTTSTIGGTQQTALDDLLSLLQGNVSDQGGTSTQSTLLGNTSLNALENLATTGTTGPTTQQSTATDTSFSTLDKLLGYTAPKIDATDTFQKGVIDPLQKTFETRTLPGIAGKYGYGAGGAYGSESEQARRQAGQDLTDTEAKYGSQYAYDVAKANQSADIAGAAVQIDALGKAKDTTLLPDYTTGAKTDIYTSLLGNTKTGYSQLDNLLSLLLGGSTGTTQQTSSVSTGGSSGLLTGVLSGAGSVLGSSTTGTVGSSLLTSLGLLSDRRAKTDVRRIGRLENELPIYLFKYKGDDKTRVGVMAQDVEKKLPEAVGRTSDGLKTVNYTTVLLDALEKAA